jgi:mRNA interferase YafQ
MTSKLPALEKRAKLPRKSDRTKQFDKDWIRLHGAGRANLRKLKEIMLLLIADDVPLPAEYKDHALQGNWAGYRDCHAGGDLVLIYKLVDDSVIFVRVGSHADLFE